MPKFQRCPVAVENLAEAILRKHESHKSILLAGVLIDFVFAFADVDEDTGERLNDALSKNGVKALGICRKIPLKDRALDRGDAEISIDGDWWAESTDEEREALLDHELHHIAVKIDKRGLVRDDLGRPVLNLRKHDVEVGWFKVIALRNGLSSQERIQARRILFDHGQAFWPGILQPEHHDTSEAAARAVRTNRVDRDGDGLSKPLLDAVHKLRKSGATVELASK